MAGRKAGALTNAIDKILDTDANATAGEHVAELKRVAKGKNEKQIAGAFNNRKTMRNKKAKPKGRRKNTVNNGRRKGKGPKGGGQGFGSILEALRTFVERAGGVDEAQKALESMKNFRL